MDNLMFFAAGFASCAIIIFLSVMLDVGLSKIEALLARWF